MSLGFPQWYCLGSRHALHTYMDESGWPLIFSKFGRKEYSSRKDSPTRPVFFFTFFLVKEPLVLANELNVGSYCVEILGLHAKGSRKCQ